jgi:hypothetical protein
VSPVNRSPNARPAVKTLMLILTSLALTVSAPAQVGHFFGNPGALADFNGDGKLDLVWSNTEGTGAARVFLGNGDSTFRFSSFLSLPSGYHGCSGLVATDLNGDGKLDIALDCFPGSGTYALVIFYGNGDGTFSSPWILPGGNFYASETLLAGDLNGDGRPDLVVTGLLGGTGYVSVGVFLNNGDGTFTPGESFAAGSIAASLLADLTGDGKLDLLITRGNGNVEPFQGKGDGTFLKHGVQYPMTQCMNSHALADFN